MSFSRRLTKTPTAGVVTPLCESGAWETVQSRKSSPDINQLEMSLIRVLKTGSGNNEKLVSSVLTDEIPDYTRTRTSSLSQKSASPLCESGTCETVQLRKSSPDINQLEMSLIRVLKTGSGNNEKLDSSSRRSMADSSIHDLRGVKNLLKTPKVSKSPENDLSDVRGVKKLFQTPRVQKSPKNDLSNIGGVKKLLKTPKVPKSPKNDLSNIGGVKKLLKTPKLPKSPKNDLSDIRGVKKLLRTPKVRKSPKNDLSNIVPLKMLMSTPKPQKEHINDLSNVSGVKDLFIEKQEELFDSVFNKKPVQKTRGKKRKVAEPAKVEVDQNKVVKTAGRPRRHLKTKIEESVTSSASKTNVDESVKPISRSKRNEKAENGESIKNINKRTESETASRSGDNKEKEIEKNDSEDKPMRITRGKKKVVNPSLNDETTSRRPKKDQTVINL
ncbi:unnamed protein product [Acanthoscelides obtectus]|uniref:Uncharacterized protein n=1 Tax=Acanthoscelides obtectus TaxID=200917 RepID=A0A9P0MIF7_ACAOB|nr:unnamed protein product [Acanthoscelides obtectus]CAK1664694.1 hypothetical protein AOBTE_LOCUS24418 [Acanthoscelides obtectus]